MPPIPVSIVHAMSAKADDIIGKNLLLGPKGTVNAPRSEVGFVAAIILGAVKGIAKAWKPLLRSAGYDLKLSGVFCHAAPMVCFRRTPSSVVDTTCELADLLVVVDSFCASGTTRTASLIQAKMASGARRVTLKGQSSPRQLDLYQRWPLFSFSDQGSYGKAQFDLQATNGEEAGTFGIIDRHFKNQPFFAPIWTQHAASPTPNKITNEPTLGAFLSNMAAQNSPNFGRQAVVNGTDDWSHVVDRLMTVTFRKSFRHKWMLKDDAARGITAQAFLKIAPERVCALVVSGGTRPPFDGIELIEDDDPNAMSVLHVVIAERGARSGE